MPAAPRVAIARRIRDAAAARGIGAEDLRRYRTRSGYKHSVLVLDEPTVFNLE